MCPVGLQGFGWISLLFALTRAETYTRILDASTLQLSNSTSFTSPLTCIGWYPSTTATCKWIHPLDLARFAVQQPYAGFHNWSIWSDWNPTFAAVGQLRFPPSFMCKLSWTYDSTPRAWTWFCPNLFHLHMHTRFWLCVSNSFKFNFCQWHCAHTYLLLLMLRLIFLQLLLVCTGMVLIRFPDILTSFCNGGTPSRTLWCSTRAQSQRAMPPRVPIDI